MKVGILEPCPYRYVRDQKGCRNAPRLQPEKIGANAEETVDPLQEAGPSNVR